MYDEPDVAALVLSVYMYVYMHAFMRACSYGVFGVEDRG